MKAFLSFAALVGLVLTVSAASTRAQRFEPVAEQACNKRCVAQCKQAAAATKRPPSPSCKVQCGC